MVPAELFDYSTDPMEHYNLTVNDQIPVSLWRFGRIGPCAGVLIGALAMIGATACPGSESQSLKEVFKAHFAVGAAINRSHATGQSGGRRSVRQVGREISLIKTQFNQITAENDMKWQHIHPREGADGYDFGPADAFVGFGEKHGLQLVGHTLVWHSQTPDWVFAGKVPPPESAGHSVRVRPGHSSTDYAGPRATREELLGRMRGHIHKVVGRYKGRVKTWDVVNEALADGPPEKYLRDSLWLRIIGPDYIAKAFEYAHEADPEAVLRYNDFGLEDPEKLQKLVRLIKSLREQNVPVHAIGTQAHLDVDSAGFERMDRSLAEIAKLGLPIHVTELDIGGGKRGQDRADADRQPAQAYEGVFRAIMKHRDSVRMVTFWGVNDAVSWRRNEEPLLFDGDCQPKPAFDAVMRVGKEPSPLKHEATPVPGAARVRDNPRGHIPDSGFAIPQVPEKIPP